MPPYPRSLTLTEFHRTWEPQGWQLLIIGPTATWRQDWGEWEGLRDIVQNSLDESEYYAWGYDDQGLFLRDIGKGVAVADFLLGPPKLKPPHARGKFGEGMKIAALALLRRGYSVTVETVGREMWLAFLRVRINGEADQLAALWRADGRRHGTVFHIVGYFGPAYEDRFAVNLPQDAILHRGPSPLAEPVQRWNQLIARPPGRIYARDIYMRDINSPFSYNLWGFEMAPDRHGPKDEMAVWTDAGRLWATVADPRLLERFLGMVVDPPRESTDESHNVTLSWMGTEPSSGKYYRDIIVENRQAWREAWERAVGVDKVLRIDSRLDSTVRHLGYQPVDVFWAVRDELGRQGIIRTDASLVKESQERLREAQVIPDDRLAPSQRAHLELARAIARSFRPPVAGVHAAIIPPASDRTRTAGMYGRTTQEVFIAADQLAAARSTVDTLIHELAHHTSGEEDLAEGHSAAMTEVASRVVELAVSGRLGEHLRDVMW